MKFLSRRQTMLVFLSLVVVGTQGCGWGGPAESDYAKAQRLKGDASSEIQRLGGKCQSREYPQGQGWIVDLSGVQLTPEVFDVLRTLGRVTELNLSHTNVSDNDLEKINEVEIGSVILKLDLSHTSITDAGLAKLSQVNFIGELNAANSQVTGEGAKKFSRGKPRKPKVLLTSK